MIVDTFDEMFLYDCTIWMTNTVPASSKLGFFELFIFPLFQMK